MPMDISGIKYPPSHPLFGSSLKAERAKHHIDEAKACIEAFLATKPFEMHRNYDTKRQQFTLRMAKADPPPLVLSTHIGDAIHNCRSAFDLLACEIVELGGGRRNQAQFPVIGKVEDFEPYAATRMKKAPDEAMDIVRSLQPYQGGDNVTLWHLHKLDILDKHQMIIPVGSSVDAVHWDLNNSIADMFKRIGVTESPPVIDPIVLRPANRQYPLRKGTVVFTQGGPVDRIDKNTKVSFTIAFGEGQVIDGEPVLPALNHFVRFTERAIEKFEKIFPRGSANSGKT